MEFTLLFKKKPAITYFVVAFSCFPPNIDYSRLQLKEVHRVRLIFSKVIFVCSIYRRWLKFYRTLQKKYRSRCKSNGSYQYASFQHCLTLYDFKHSGTHGASKNSHALVAYINEIHINKVTPRCYFAVLLLIVLLLLNST